MTMPSTRIASMIEETHQRAQVELGRIRDNSDFAYANRVYISDVQHIQDLQGNAHFTIFLSCKFQDSFPDQCREIARQLASALAGHHTSPSVEFD